MKPYYQHGGITIYHGDCRNSIHALEFDTIISDPPYGMSYKHGLRKGGVSQGHDGRSIEGDFEPFDPSHIIALNRPTILWGANHFASRLPNSPGWLVWHKRNPGEHNDQSDCEIAWTNILTTARTFVARWSGAHKTGREQREQRYHVNQKPIALMDWCIGFTDARAILDPYMGSGSTLIAAKERGLLAIGFEIDEANCEIAAKRLAQENLFAEASFV